MRAEDEAKVEAHNRRRLWRNVALRLDTAAVSVEAAQGLLEDLGNGEYADQLQPIVDQLRTARTEAEEAAT